MVRLTVSELRKRSATWRRTYEQSMTTTLVLVAWYQDYNIREGLPTSPMSWRTLMSRLDGVGSV